MKRDIIVAGGITLLVFGVGIVFYEGSNQSYSIKDEEIKEEVVDEVNEGKLDDGALDYYFPSSNVATTYSIDDVYDSIYKLKDTNVKVLDVNFLDIYVNFYSYFNNDSLFYNMYGESYDYDEYNYVINNHLLKDNKDVLGLYLTTYTKCETFSMVSDTTDVLKLGDYCSNEPER